MVMTNPDSPSLAKLVNYPDSMPRLAREHFSVLPTLVLLDQSQ